MNLMFDVVNEARKYLYVREIANNPNHGQRVEAIQRWGGGKPGDSWCAYFATMVLDICYQGNSPIPRTGSCQEIYDLAKSQHMITTNPMPGDLFLYVDENDHAHHVGFVTTVYPRLNGIAGNTSKDGKSSNGDGVYEHEISSDVIFVDYTR